MSNGDNMEAKQEDPQKEIERLRARIMQIERKSSSTATPAPSVEKSSEIVEKHMSEKQRKKAEKTERKRVRALANFREQTELHSSKVVGIVGSKDRIIVPEYMVNGGADVKWEADPCDMDLKGIISPQDYFNTITELNEATSHARAKPIDTALAIASGFLLFPLIPWAIRHRKHRTKHKKILVEQIQKFNDKWVSRGVRMRWRRKPDSQLVFERIPIPEGL